MAGTDLANTVIPEVSDLAWLDSLGAYNTSAGNAMQLDIARLVQTYSQQFFWSGVAVPRRNDISFEARQTRETTLSLQPKSLLLTISGYSSEVEGFSISIMDKGSKTNLLSKDFIFRGNLAEPLARKVGARPNAPIGPQFMLSPYILTTPGQLQVKITNRSGSAATIQCCLGFAVPFIAEKRVPLTGESGRGITRIMAGGYGNGGNTPRKSIVTSMPLVNNR